MDWTQIVIAALGLFGAIDLGRLVFFKSSKKKANAEADAVVGENEGKAVETLKNVISELRLDNQRKDEMMAQYLSEREQFRLDREERAEENATVKNAMCLHWGCVLRHPGLGRGDSWYQAHKDDPALGGDYLPINQLLKQYGMSKKSKATGAEGAEDGTEGE